MPNRVQIPINFSYPQTVWVASSSGGSPTSTYTVDVPVVGAAVTITYRDIGGSPTVFSGETGGGTIGSLSTDAGGNVPGWVTEGSYEVTAASVGGFSGASVAWEAARGDGVANVAAGVIGLSQLGAPIQNALVPTGTVLDFAGSTAPTGFVLANGAVYAIGSTGTTYNALSLVCGTTWNTGGEGGGNFRVPDFRGVTLVGAGTGSGLTARTLGPRSIQTANAGVVGGQETHSLVSTESGYPGGTLSGSVTGSGSGSGTTSGETAAHRHFASDSRYFWIMEATGTAPIDYYIYVAPSNPANVGVATFSNTATESADHAHTFSVSSSVSGTATINSAAKNAASAHNIMQPFAVTNKIIKL